MNARVPPHGHESLPTLVLIHDVSSSPAEFGLIAQILAARGVRFDFIDIPGYTHGHDRAASAWREWLASAGRLIDRDYASGSPIVLGGCGTGGALAAALALARRTQRVCGVALLSPVFSRDVREAARSPWQRVAAAVGLDRWGSVAHEEPFGIKNPKTRKWVARELEERGMSAIGPARVPLRALRESDRLSAHVRASLASLSAPLLVLHATDDDVASLASVVRVVEPLGAAARLIALEHSHHRITVDNDRQRVAHELADFVGAPKRTAARTPAPASAAAT